MIVKEGQLSIGLIFRNVTQSLTYDNISSKRIIDDTFHNRKRKYKEKCDVFDETRADFERTKTFIQDKFTEHATKKLSSFNWIKS